LKKRTKKFLQFRDVSLIEFEPGVGAISKSFLVLFFKQELLALLLSTQRFYLPL
jgi:hypothetical protein